MNMALREPGRNPKRPQKDMAEALRGFVTRLHDEADKRVKSRVSIENRWIEDLMQYHGRYDRETMQNLKDKKGSQVFLNLTRAKTNAMMARLWDLLFPTDDRNWGIQPTPVPELDDEIEAQLTLADDATESFKAQEEALRAAETRVEAGGEDAGAAEAEAQKIAADMERIEAVRNAAQEAADQLAEIHREATRRCDLMEKEIEDQLTECRYQAEARMMIRDACKIGTGVIKGPVVGERLRKRWRKTSPVAAKSQGGVVEDVKTEAFELVDHQSDAPAAEWVDPWSYFPTLDIRDPADDDSVFERHLMKAHMLRKLARRIDINEDAVRSLLERGPGSDTAPSYLLNLREITSQDQIKTEDLYHVWEFTGVLAAEDLELLYEAGIDDRIGEVIDGVVDPLEEIHVRLWFCQDQLLSFALHPLDSNDPIYSVYNLQEDESSQFGFGVPYLMRDEQAALNASKRMMLDNAGLSVGPQVMVNKKVITPEDGDWKLRPMKIWVLDDQALEESKVQPFDTFDIEGHQTELANLMELQRQDIDEVTSLPQIAQGEQGSGVTKTAQGMALLMNSANVGFRMFVKNFDDNVTVPLITRFYHWNMQFSDKDEIKGDYEVDARGSSVLLVREMQSNNLMMIMTGLGPDPEYGPWLKKDNMLKNLFRSLNIAADENLKTQREYERDQEKAAEQADPVVQLEMQKLQLEQQKVEMMSREMELKAAMLEKEWDTRLAIAQMEMGMKAETETAKLNAAAHSADAQASDKAQAAAIKADSDERKLATEVAMAERTGKSAGGSV